MEENNNEIKEENTVVTVVPDDIDPSTNLSFFSYWIGDKQKSTALSGEVQVVINGKYEPMPLISDIKPTSGTVTLLSNDYDKDIDVIIVKRYSHYVIDSIDSTDLVIYDKYGKPPLELEPEGKNVKCTRVGGTTDISAGQLIDRTGVMLGLQFPAGKQLDALSKEAQGREVFKVKCPEMEFSLSGVQNKVQQFHKDDPAETAAYALRCVAFAVYKATENAMKRYPGLEVVFSGGVASNSMLRQLTADLHPVYCAPQYSTDNAMGVAVLTHRLMEEA